MFFTKGQVVSTYSCPASSMNLYTSLPTPWERSMMVDFSDISLSSSRLFKILTPLSSRRFITSSLCITGPYVYICFPDPAASSAFSNAVSTALFTPKQKPAFSAKITSISKPLRYSAFASSVIFATTSSMVMYEESTSTASSACLRGAISRFIS